MPTNRPVTVESNVCGLAAPGQESSVGVNATTEFETSVNSRPVSFGLNSPTIAEE